MPYKKLANRRNTRRGSFVGQPRFQRGRAIDASSRLALAMSFQACRADA